MLHFRSHTVSYCLFLYEFLILIMMCRLYDMPRLCFGPVCVVVQQCSALNACVNGVQKLCYCTSYDKLSTDIKVIIYESPFPPQNKKKKVIELLRVISQFWLYFSQFVILSKHLTFFSEFWVYISFKEHLILCTKGSVCITKCIFRSKKNVLVHSISYLY